MFWLEKKEKRRKKREKEKKEYDLFMDVGPNTILSTIYLEKEREK